MKLVIRRKAAREIENILKKGAWNPGEHPRGQPENAGQFAPKGGEKAIYTADEAIEALGKMAVPMDVRELSKAEFDALFPNGKVNTPLGEVKIGENQYSKLVEKDNGGRQRLMGAMHQTLSDPIVVIEEEGGALVYIKSFTVKNAPDYRTVMSVVIEKGGQKISISTYQRKKREVLDKIKRAGSIAFLKSADHQPHAQTPPEDDRQLPVSHIPPEKSSPF